MSVARKQKLTDTRTRRKSISEDLREKIVCDWLTFA